MKRYFYAACSAVCVLYTLWYMHFGKPWTNGGALSTIGLRHRVLFAIWGVLTWITISFGIHLVCQKNQLNRKIFLPLLSVSAAGMALTLLFRFDYDIVPDYYLHCIGSLTFSAVTGVTVFLLFFLLKNKLFTVLTAVILLTDTICLLIFKETGLIEVLPIVAGIVMLNISLRRERIEAARTTESS